LRADGAFPKPTIILFCILFWLARARGRNRLRANLFSWRWQERKMVANTSRDLPGTKPRHDKQRDTQEAIIEDADKTEGKDRDLVHGEGGTIDLPTKPGDMSKDD
jgi:hypothetical protein